MNINTLKRAAAGLLLIGSFGLAQAAAPVHDLGTITVAPVGFDSASLTGSFDDVFKFQVGAGVKSVVGGIVGTADSTADSTDFTFNFQTSFDGSHWSGSTPVALATDVNGFFSASQIVTGLSAGPTYWFRISGTTVGADYSLNLAPVPEPETYAMLLAGLGLMGFIARRRKSTNTTSGV